MNEIARSVCAEIIAAAEFATNSESKQVIAFGVLLLGRLQHIIDGGRIRTMDEPDILEWAKAAGELLGPDPEDRADGAGA